jgi:hypothetical protein
MTTDNATIVKVCKALDIPPEWLYKLISFESHWDPLAKAGIPFNKAKVDAGTEAPRFARGLIQFIDSTARDLGYTSADNLVERNPTIDDQLMFPVLQYLKKYAPFPTEQSFYLSVFYPAARNWPASKVFPDSVRAANPGIKCPADYVNKVKGGNSTVFVAIAAGLLFVKIAGKYLKWF